MSKKRIIFAVLCALLALVVIMTVVTAVKLVQLLGGSNTPDPTETTPSTLESTEPSTDASSEPSTEATMPPTTEATVAPTTKPTTPSTDSHTHNFSTVLDSQAPSCTDGGYRELLCNCGETYWEVLNKLDHTFGYGETIPASCTEDGYTRFTCSTCGYEDKRNVVPATGHDFENGTFHKATCTEDAYTVCANSNCTEKKVQEDSKLGHNFGPWIKQNNVWTQSCGNCDASYTSDELKIKHRFLDGPNNSYRVHELDIGTEDNPVIYRYKITDLINNNTIKFDYAYSTGLTIEYVDNLGNPHVVVLSATGGQHTIEDTTTEETDPSEPSDPTDPSGSTDPTESTGSDD